MSGDALQQVSWSTWGEWHEVAASVFRDAPPLSPCAPGTPALERCPPEAIPAALQGWAEVLERADSWRARRTALPALALCTFDLLEVIVSDWENEFGEAAYALRPRTLQLAYSTAVIRAINIATDMHQTTSVAKSISHLASTIGLPAWLVEVRHNATHKEIVPSLQMLRLAASEILDWLKDNYWKKQLAVSRKTVAQASSKKSAEELLDELKVELFEFASTRPDRIDTCVDRLTALVPGPLFATTVEQRLVDLLVDPLNKLDDAEPWKVYWPWERVLAGLDDHFVGFTGSLINRLCDLVVDDGAKLPARNSEGETSKRRRIEIKASETSVRLALGWVTYFASRRWHSMSDSELSTFRSHRESRKKGSSSTQTINLLEVHPNRWTSTQRNWVLETAPKQYHDGTTVLACLKKALMNPHTYSQRLVAVLVPAACPDSTVCDALEAATDLIRVKLDAPLSGARMNRLDIEDAEQLCASGVPTAGEAVNAGPWSLELKWTPIPIGAVPTLQSRTNYADNDNSGGADDASETSEDDDAMGLSSNEKEEDASPTAAALPPVEAYADLDLVKAASTEAKMFC